MHQAVVLRWHGLGRLRTSWSPPWSLLWDPAPLWSLAPAGRGKRVHAAHTRAGGPAGEAGTQQAAGGRLPSGGPAWRRPRGAAAATGGCMGARGCKVALLGGAQPGGVCASRCRRHLQLAAKWLVAGLCRARRSCRNGGPSLLGRRRHRPRPNTRLPTPPPYGCATPPV